MRSISNVDVCFLVSFGANSVTVLDKIHFEKKKKTHTEASVLSCAILKNHT